LRELGVPVYNDARAVERSVDKAMTSFLLRLRGLPTPPTWVTESIAEARAIVLRETAAGHQVVSKPLFGSQGNGLVRISMGGEVPPAEAVNGVWYLQRYVGAPDDSSRWQDWRVLVIGGHAVAAMKRHGRYWINNVAQGARCEGVKVDEPLDRLAIDAARAVEMDYAGVDIIRDEEDRLQVLEVNSIPAWKGLQAVCPIDIAQAMVDDLVDRRLRSGKSLEAVC
jgi:RimK family alpha-L-glutamate ligase